MNELVPVLAALVEEVEAGRAAALCVVVATNGSTPRQPGAAMTVRGDGSTVGTIGGGEVESAAAAQASEWIGQGVSARFDSSLDDAYAACGGMICGGRMQVAVRVVSTCEELTPFAEALERARRREPASVVLDVEHEGRRLVYRLNLEVPPTLLVAGAGHVGQAVAKLADELGFHVVVLDDRADIASRERFAEPIELRVGDVGELVRGYPIDGGCYVVIVTRGHQHDEYALRAAVGRGAAYVGMMGSRKKAASVLDALRADGVSDETLSNVHTPIGLSIGALTVPELAVSVMGEVIGVRRRATPKLVEVVAR